MIKCWLSRDESGYYGMWGIKPIARRILNSIRRAFYPASYHDFGEPVMWRGMCPEVTDALSGKSIRVDPMGEPVRIRAIIIREDRMTDQLAELILYAQRPDESEY